MLVKALNGVRVLDDAGAAINLGPQGKAALLAIAEAGRPVSAAELLNLLWERHPKLGTQAVVKLMSKLRGQLGADRLVHEHGGYRLVVRREDYVDLWAWRKLAERCRQLSVSEPHTAGLLFSRTLGLWGGVPQTDLPDTVEMQLLIRRLRDERLDLIERQAEVRLRLGQDREVAAELRPLADAEPQREHLLYLLMLALYRAHRPAEALQLYDALHRRRSGGHGPSPNPTLQRLCQQIFDADAALFPEPEPLPAADRAVLATGADPHHLSNARMEHHTCERRAGQSRFSTARDRAAVEYILAAAPEFDQMQVDSDLFGVRVARRLACEHHIDQFIELCAPILSRYSLHTAVHQPRPAARVVYAHRSAPIVRHCQNLLRDRDQVAFVGASLREPRSITDHPRVRELIDWSRPVAIIDRHEANLTPETDEPARLYGELVAAAAPGSYLVVTALCSELSPARPHPHVADVDHDVPADDRLVFRDREQIARLLPRYLQIQAGVADINEIWGDTPPSRYPWRVLGAIARKSADEPKWVVDQETA